MTQHILNKRYVLEQNFSLDLLVVSVRVLSSQLISLSDKKLLGEVWVGSSAGDLGPLSRLRQKTLNWLANDHLRLKSEDGIRQDFD